MLFPRPFTAVFAFFILFGTASAQRHDAGSAPPTAPPPKQIIVPPPIISNPINAGIGSLLLTSIDAAAPAPQALATELQSSDDRMRTSALASIGAPSQYLNRGHVPFPRSIRLDFLALGSTPELDALLTVQLDQHLISAILAPVDDEWHRVAIMTYPLTANDRGTTLATFVRSDRSLLDPTHYDAIFHAATNGSSGDLTENEAHLRIINGHATVVMSFASTERTCDPTHQHTCELTERWLQSDASSTNHQVLLVTATGHIRPPDSDNPIAHAEIFETSHLRSFTCQPFVVSDITHQLQSSAGPTSCIPSHEGQHEPPAVPLVPPKN